MLLEVTLRGPYAWGGRRDEESGSDHPVGDAVDQRLDRVMDHLLSDPRALGHRVDLDLDGGTAALVVSVESPSAIAALDVAVSVARAAVAAAGGALRGAGEGEGEGEAAEAEWTLDVTTIQLRETPTRLSEL